MIDADEMAAAAERLLSRDNDDDGVVLLAELKDTVDEMMPQAQMMSNRRRVAEPDTALWLTEKTVDVSKRWGMYQFQLQELYSFGGSIGLSDWPMTPDLFRLLDANADSELARAEIARIVDVPPHLVCEVEFDGSHADGNGPRVRLVKVAPEISQLNPAMREMPTRISIQLPTVTLELFVNEDPSLNNIASAAKAQFMALDREKVGYLESADTSANIPGLDTSYASLDADGDGKIYESEFVAYAQRRNLVTRSQVRARAADQEDALYSALDIDGDGRLNAREIRQASARQRALDRNGDGKLQTDEIPGSMIVAFIRGNPQQDNQLFSSAALVAPPENANLPRWFRGMDANRDGEISPSEFFGTREVFQRLDLDHDGFLSAEEAGKIEAAGKGELGTSD
jgi:Ca2+-binding EF-hand superfamily protein